jgi:hypothetical protein
MKKEISVQIINPGSALNIFCSLSGLLGTCLG